MSKKINLNQAIVALFFVLVIDCATFAGPIIYVDVDATGKDNGASWSDAYSCLQDALSIASNGDKIRVAQGIYKPDQGAGVEAGDRETTFQLVSGVIIEGGYAGPAEQDSNVRDIDLYETFLSGDIGATDYEMDNSYHVVMGANDTVIDGFTITGGFASDKGDPDLAGNGGGMFNLNVSPTVRNCVFVENSALNNGGGMANWQSSPTITNCMFIANDASHGAGMMNWSSSPILNNCVFQDNFARVRGGALESKTNSSPKVTHSDFINNQAKDGGAIWVNYNCFPKFEHCEFKDNTATGNGGAIYSSSTTGIALKDCRFSNNTTKSGSAVYCNYVDTVEISNCSFGNNSVFIE